MRRLHRVKLTAALGIRQPLTKTKAATAKAKTMANQMIMPPTRFPRCALDSSADGVWGGIARWWWRRRKRKWRWNL